MHNVCEGKMFEGLHLDSVFLMLKCFCRKLSQNKYRVFLEYV